MASESRASWRYLAALACIVGIVVISILIRLERDARAYLRQGDEWAARGESAEAAFSWKMSVLSYVPFSPTPRKAAERLWASGVAFEQAGRTDEALRAFRYLRSALLGIRHVVQPMSEMIPGAEERIAALMPAGEGKGRLRELAARHGTAPAAIPLLIAGVAGWPASILFLIRRWGRGERIGMIEKFLLPAASLAALIAGVCIS